MNLRNVYKTSIIFILLTVTCWAGQLPEPPKLSKNRLNEQQEYFKNIYDNFNNLEVVTTNPDGSRNGHYGDIVLLFTGGNYYVEICVSSPSGTIWRGVLLSNTP